MLLFSEGLPFDVKQMMGQDALRSMGASGLYEGMQAAIAAATRANVSIYTIDPRGTTVGDDDIAVSSFANEPSLGLGQAGLNEERRAEQQSLRLVAEETGGFAVVNTSQFADAPSTGSSTTTAPTMCSPTIRPRPSGMASSTRSR